jgi:hypothetical protein
LPWPPQERLSQLQSTCLALGAPGPHAGLLAPPAGLGEARAGGFLDQVSATLLVLSKEQPGPAVEPSRAKAAAEGLPTDLRLALRELEAARREREGLRAKVQMGA